MEKEEEEEEEEERELLPPSPHFQIPQSFRIHPPLRVHLFFAPVPPSL